MTPNPFVHLKTKLMRNTRFSLEYFVYIVSASSISAIGLITDSPTSIIASMVICPIMGYVSCLSVGTVLNDICLIKRGATGLFMSLGIGDCMGIQGGCHMLRYPCSNKRDVETNKINQSLLGRFLGGSVWCGGRMLIL